MSCQAHVFWVTLGICVAASLLGVLIIYLAHVLTVKTDSPWPMLVAVLLILSFLIAVTSSYGGVSIAATICK